MSENMPDPNEVNKMKAMWLHKPTGKIVTIQHGKDELGEYTDTFMHTEVDTLKSRIRKEKFGSEYEKLYLITEAQLSKVRLMAMRIASEIDSNRLHMEEGYNKLPSGVKETLEKCEGFARDIKDTVGRSE